MYPRVLDSFLLFFRLLLCNSCNLQYFISNLTVCSVSVCNMQAPCDDIFVDYFFTLDCGRKTAPEYKSTKSTIWAQQGHKMHSESTKQTLWSHSEHKKDFVFLPLLKSLHSLHFGTERRPDSVLHDVAISFWCHHIFFWYNIFFLSATMFLSNGTMFSFQVPPFFPRTSLYFLK